MKLLTLNAHSLVEKEYEMKLHQFAEVIVKERPDVFALQEVNQSVSAMPCANDLLTDFNKCKDCDMVIRTDNHAARLAALLRTCGLNYYWTWLPIKLGWGIYDEGLAMFSSQPILETKRLEISGIQEYSNWKRRMALGIRTTHKEDVWYYSIHMGWWNDVEEPFQEEWNRMESLLKDITGNVWIMGDFNSPAEVRGEGYDYVKSFGWHDTYNVATTKIGEHTIECDIDGWKDGSSQKTKERIDQIWSKEIVNVKSSRVICDGKNYPIVSDHYGVVIEVDE